MARKKQKPKKRVISKTEKSLKGKLKYQQKKLRNESAIISELLIKNDFNFDAVVGRGKNKKKLKTIINNVAENQNKINKEINLLAGKLKRFGYKRKLPTEPTIRDEDGEDSETAFTIVLGNAWHKPNALDYIFKSGEVFTINGKSIKKDADKVITQMMEYYGLMDSETELAVNLDLEGNAQMFIGVGINGVSIIDEN